MTAEQQAGQQSRAARALALIENLIADMVIETNSPIGLPSGPLYAGLMSHMSLDTYQSIIARLCQQGRVEQRNHTLHPGPKAKHSVTGSEVAK